MFLYRLLSAVPPLSISLANNLLNTWLILRLFPRHFVKRIKKYPTANVVVLPSKLVKQHRPVSYLRLFPWQPHRHLLSMNLNLQRSVKRTKNAAPTLVPLTQCFLTTMLSLPTNAYMANLPSWVMKLWFLLKVLDRLSSVLITK